MKLKIAYFVSISLAMIVSFMYLSAQLESYHARAYMVEKNLEKELVNQQMQRLPAVEQMSSPVLLQIALLEERLEAKQAYLASLQPYTSPWLLGIMLLLWTLALVFWYLIRRQLPALLQQPIGWRLWLGRLLFYAGVGLIFGSAFLPIGLPDKSELLWGLLAGLVLAALGVGLRMNHQQSVSKQRK